MGSLKNRTRADFILPNEMVKKIKLECEETGMPKSRIAERLIRKGMELEESELRKK